LPGWCHYLCRADRSDQTSHSNSFCAAADNHQEWNARELERAGGAEVILEKDFKPEILLDRLKFYLNNHEALIRMGDNLQKLKRTDSADRLARLALDMIEAEGRRG